MIVLLILQTMSARLDMLHSCRVRARSIALALTRYGSGTVKEEVLATTEDLKPLHVLRAVLPCLPEAICRNGLLQTKGCKCTRFGSPGRCAHAAGAGLRAQFISIAAACCWLLRRVSQSPSDPVHASVSQTQHHALTSIVQPQHVSLAWNNTEFDVKLGRPPDR